MRRLQDVNVELMVPRRDARPFTADSLCRALGLPGAEPELAPGTELALRFVLWPAFDAESVIDVTHGDGTWWFSIRSARIQLFQFANHGTRPDDIDDRLGRKLLPPGVWVYEAHLRGRMPRAFRSIQKIRAAWADVPGTQLDGIGFSVLARDRAATTEFSHAMTQGVLATHQTQARLAELLNRIIQSCQDPDAAEVVKDAACYLP